MPIKIEAEDMQEALLSSMIAAISNLTTVLLKEPLDYTVIQNSTDILLVIQFDEAKILAIALPESHDSKIGYYLAKIKEIVKKCNPNTALSSCD